MGPVGRFEREAPGPGSRPGSTQTTAARRGPACAPPTGAAESRLPGLRPSDGQRSPDSRACAASEANALPGTLSKRWERKNPAFPARVTVRSSETEGPPLFDTPKPASTGGLKPGVSSPASASARPFPNARAVWGERGNTHRGG